MLSGIGDESHLATHGIGCEHHLPGVGANLMDHACFSLGFGAPERRATPAKGSNRIKDSTVCPFVPMSPMFSVVPTLPSSNAFSRSRSCSQRKRVCTCRSFPLPSRPQAPRAAAVRLGVRLLLLLRCR